MNPSNTRLVILIAVLAGVAASVIVQRYGPVAALPQGAMGIVLVFGALAVLRQRAGSSKVM